MELYIQKQKIFDSGISVSADTFIQITDYSKSWVIDQWKNYYVYIVNGPAAGQISKINSNDVSYLFFDALTEELDGNDVYEIIDFPYERVEMFQDEKVSVTSTIQNYSDIGKLFTDYSQFILKLKN